MSGIDSRERLDAIIVGAGQAGLAAGYYLARRGLSFLILERSTRIGDVWRNRWDSLRLYSPARSDGLPGMPFPAPAWHYPTTHEMGDYLEAYAATFNLPVVTASAVDELRPSDDGEGYVASTGDRRFEGSQVILASGGFQRPYVPDFARRLDPSIRQLHSSEYRNPAQLRDGPVLVVGASHSGADVAFEVAAAHRTYLSGRDHGQLPFAIDSRRARVVWPLLLFGASHLLTTRTPIGRRMAPKVRAGGAPLLRYRRSDLEAVGVERLDPKVVDARDGRPLLADGRVLDVANVVWCTGFRPDFGWVRLPVVGDDGWPRQSRGVIEGAPGLYVLGVPFQYAFTSMLVAGAGRDARYVVDRLAERVGERSVARRVGVAATP